ncbi:ankyrin repeat-containing domain protein [Colletotrichum cereale]|nr:ankyrin repeat-containing domain protein [Colletotrichum cereale]
MSDGGQPSDPVIRIEPKEQLVDEQVKLCIQSKIYTDNNTDKDPAVKKGYVPVTMETITDEGEAFATQQPPQPSEQQCVNAATRLVTTESQSAPKVGEESFSKLRLRPDPTMAADVNSLPGNLTNNRNPIKSKPRSQVRSTKGQAKKVRIGNSFYIPHVSGGFNYASEDTSHSRNKGSSRNRRRPALRGGLPVINADKLILDTWDLASSMPTSVLSEHTKSSISQFFLMIPNMNHMQGILTAHCRNGKASAVRYILENMRPHNIPKTFFRGPVWACVKGASSRHNKCLRALIEADANINMKSKKTGKTPLHVAVEHDDFKGYTNLIWLLINNKANPNIKDSSGDYPLTKLFAGNDVWALRKHRLAALAILLQGGAKVDSTQPGTGNTPLHLAVRRQDKLAVAILLYKGANVNAKTTWGTTPLQMTANQFRGNLTDDHAHVLDLLLQNRANVDEPAGQNRRTALHRAVVTGTAQAVEMLLRHGASPSLQEASGKDARDLAVAHAADLTRDATKSPDRRIDDHVEIMERLFQDRKRDWPMNRSRCVVDLACDGNAVEGHRILTKLLSMGLSKNTIFGDKGTIPELALQRGSLEVYKLFS